jgi:hypothetical protein
MDSRICGNDGAHLIWGQLVIPAQSGKFIWLWARSRGASWEMSQIVLS